MRPAVLVSPSRSPPPDVSMTATLNDRQGAAVLGAIVESEIAQAHIAEGKAASGGVADFVQAVMTRRLATERDLAGFISMLPRGLETSAMLERVEADRDHVTSNMAGQTGADFDLAYVAGQIHAFERDIAVIDTRLVPDAQAHELERIATELRADIVQELGTARSLRRQLLREGVGPGATRARACPPQRKPALSDRPCS